jgi:hypothetical protein
LAKRSFIAGNRGGGSGACAQAASSAAASNGERRINSGEADDKADGDGDGDCGDVDMMRILESGVRALNARRRTGRAAA